MTVTASTSVETGLMQSANIQLFAASDSCTANAGQLLLLSTIYKMRLQTPLGCRYNTRAVSKKTLYRRNDLVRSRPTAALMQQDYDNQTDCDSNCHEMVIAVHKKYEIFKHSPPITKPGKPCTP
jgi:hypothetical protein